MKTALALAALAFAVAGCGATVSSVLFDPAHPLAPQPAGTSVAMFSTRPPTCAYDEVGTVFAEIGPGWDANRLTVAMQESARQMGGDGITKLEQGTRSVNGGEQRNLTGTVIRFRDVGCRH